MRKASSVMKKTFSPSSSTPEALDTTPTTSTTINDESPLPPVPDTSTDNSNHLTTGPSITSLNDDAILPSTSTFTLNKEDRPEKLKKKTKNFMDEKQKIKSRLQSLWSYIDATNTFDQSRFFQENAEQVFLVVYESCMHQIEKMKQRNERPQSWHSKELVSLQKTLLLLRKIFLFVPELMRNGWQRKNIAKILSHILDHGNHIRLRSLGFHLLLLWLNDQVVEYPECMNLFANAISLDLFIMDDITLIASPNTHIDLDTSHTNDESIGINKSHTHGTGGGLQFVKKLGERHSEKLVGYGLVRNERIKKAPIQLQQTIILGDEHAPLYPNPTVPTYNDSVVLLNIFITNLVRLAYVASGSPPPPDNYDYPDQCEADDGIATGVGIDAATASAKFLFRVFRTYYLTKFLPHVSNALQEKETSLDNTGESIVIGFPSCPPSVLRTLLRFLIGYCLDNNRSSHVNWPNLPTSANSSPAIPILKSIVLSSHETREMLHEVLRQCMILPTTNTNYRDIIRGAVHILGAWMLGSEDERPSFLRRTGGPTSSNTITTMNTNNNNNNNITRSSSYASLAASSKHSIHENMNNTSSSSMEKILPTSPINQQVSHTLSAPFNTSSSISSLSAVVSADHDYVEANVFLRQYFFMIRMLFIREEQQVGNTAQVGELELDSQLDWDGLVTLYKDAVNVYRAMTVTRSGIEMEWESWESLLRCLLDIHEWMMQTTDRTIRIPVTSLADDFADYICETLLHAFARARIAHTEYWQDLKKRQVASMDWPEVLEQWVKIMHRLTKVLSSKLYKVDYESYRTHSDKSGAIHNRLSGYLHGGITGTSGVSSGTSGGRKLRSRHLSIQDEQRGATNTRNSGGAIRPISIGGSGNSSGGVGSSSEGQLMGLTTKQQEQPFKSERPMAELIDGFPLPPGVEIPTTVSTSYSPSSLAAAAGVPSTTTTSSTTERPKASDRRSGTGLAVESIDEDKATSSPSSPGTVLTGSHSTSRKFGIKNIIPTTSFSSSQSSSALPTIEKDDYNINNNRSSGGGSISAGNIHQHNQGTGSASSSLGSRRGKRTVSIHQFDHLIQESGSKLLNFVHHTTSSSTAAAGLQSMTSTEPTLAVGPNVISETSTNNTTSLDTGMIQPSSSKLAPGTLFVKDGDDRGRNVIEWDRRSNASSNITVSSKSNRTSASTILAPSELITMKMTTANVNDKLPLDLGIFRSVEFLNLQNLPWDGLGMLLLWKNMLCSLGDINDIKTPQNHSMAIKCVVDIWDTLVWIRSNQPYRGVPIPALYEVTPWLFKATELPSTFDTGRAAAFGCLCRLVCRKPEESLSANFYAHFYRAILKGLSSDNNTIIQAIIQNSERLFAFSLPGVHILVPPFLHAIEKQLLDGNIIKDVPIPVRKSCISILGSLTSISNHFSDVKIEIKPDSNTTSEEKEFNFADVKIWLKDLLIRLVTTGTSTSLTDENAEVHCMLLGAICAHALDELLSCKDPQRDIIHECILAMVNHLYWCNINIVNTVTDCLVLVAHIYRESLDPDGVIVQEVLTRIIDAMNVHLKFYENNPKSGRGLIVSKLFSCLLEWLMTIEPEILTDTELCQLVFDVIEYAIHVSTDDSDKVLPHPPVIRSTSRSKKKEIPFKFKLLTEKRPQVHQDHTQIVTGSDQTESDQDFVKEAAEAVLFHLLHHFNNFAPPYGPATIHSTIVGPGVSPSSSSSDDKNDIECRQYQYFSFNDTTIIAFLELPSTDTKPAESRMILRDLTGRYVWDAHLESPTGDPFDQPLPVTPNLSPAPIRTPDTVSHLLDREQGYVLRSSISVQKDESSIQQSTSASLPSSPDTLNSLLQEIGEQHPDCVISSVPLNAPAPLSSLQTSMVGRLGEQLNDYLTNEQNNNLQKESDPRLWYSKLNVLRRRGDQTNETTHAQSTANFSLRKDFSPAFPHELEKTNLPFQQSRLLMSHLGLINYSHLKDGSFQMLNKTAALYRDLRGLDRKPGRETMKIGVVYVGPEQEDEQSILHNSQGSSGYDAFVNSLGWEIDIATHTGYLGGLERNLTNGTKATYYCSSTVEIMFHDVTKMPTDAYDVKQLKKKRHIGNDHVHIVWNEHSRDYRVGTIGGDFGNAQIVVTPLSDGLYSIQVYRDPKLPYFGPLFDEMVVSRATLGPLVRATAISAFRACVHTSISSFHRCVFSQRARDVKTITQRHKIANWSYEKFMERIFMPDE
ncbi:uncharacterized protein BX664DRAFT_295379 [Halteromyces radiatus]|uniref:uncharacterized protein n=1 Tax=Halteromyces radiatus TaxID=101107 RepID=UPI002220FD75|nr:uncharacterized protein BX664DRAFT_295379 [Halteromyces radiatus]KAI8093558.1 hypothetical protein BX664DRAFT_295379 [Halteromyces radiatus]